MSRFLPRGDNRFLESSDYESAIRLAIPLGGNSDIIACMTGGIAAAYYGVPNEIVSKAKEYLPNDMLAIIDEFDNYSRSLLSGEILP